jgi:acetyl esterase/lipase
MKLVCLLISISVLTAHAQQKVIQLYNGAAPGSESWNWKEGENDNNSFHTKVAYNVTSPSLIVFRPEGNMLNGTAVIICPGGGFHTLSINSEGNDVANWLVKKGITCFVLKYRLVHSLTNDPVAEVMAKIGKPEFEDDMKPVIPLAISDGRMAISYVRQHASEYGVNADRIGIIGFSAGGTVAASAAYNYDPLNRPDFVAPIYAFMPPELQGVIAKDAPPMFVAAASDDQLGFAQQNIDLYNKWLASKHPAELHMYARGGHGFGMRIQHLPSDKWIERFGEWLDMQGLLQPKK